MKWRVSFVFETDTDNEELATQKLAKSLTLEFNQLITNLKIRKEIENRSISSEE